MKKHEKHREQYEKARKRWDSSLSLSLMMMIEKKKKKKMKAVTTDFSREAGSRSIAL